LKAPAEGFVDRRAPMPKAFFTQIAVVLLEAAVTVDQRRECFPWPAQAGALAGTVGPRVTDAAAPLRAAQVARRRFRITRAVALVVHSPTTRCVPIGTGSPLQDGPATSSPEHAGHVRHAVAPAPALQSSVGERAPKRACPTRERSARPETAQAQPHCSRYRRCCHPAGAASWSRWATSRIGRR
jgi:hypothetical protein